MIENCLWAVQKFYIQILSPLRIEEDRDDGDGLVSILAMGLKEGV